MQPTISESITLLGTLTDFFTPLREFIGVLAGIAVLITATITIKNYLRSREEEKNGAPRNTAQRPLDDIVNTVGNFRVRLGNKANPGFLPEVERLMQIKAGKKPFVTGTELPENSPVFVGRAQIMHAILTTLRHPDKPSCVSLLGERRMGKSSLLNQIFADLGREEGLVTVLSSPQGWHEYTPAAFFSDLHQAIKGAITGASSMDKQDGSSSSPVMDYPGFREFIRRYADRYRFVLILDEFETMAGNQKFNAQFFDNLRHLGSTPEFRFGYLLASRRPLSELRKQDLGFGGSSFWNIFGIACGVGLLRPEDVQELIREPWQRSLQGETLPAEEIEMLDELVGTHPAFLQMVLERMWTARAGMFELDRNEIRRGLWEHFGDLWKNRSREEKAILSNISKEEPVPENALLWDLRSRGLIAGDNRLFSEFFKDFVIRFPPDSSPESPPDHGN